MSVSAQKKNETRVSENARIVLERRYLKKDDNGRPIETPEDMFRRVAKISLLPTGFMTRTRI